MIGRTLIFRRERVRPIILDGSYARSGGSYIQPAENEAGLRIAWNNTWWTMALSPCHVDRRALVPCAPPLRTHMRKAQDPKTRPESPDESKRSQPLAPTIDQRDDPIREATRRRHNEESRSRCDRPGDEIRLGPLDQKIRSQAEIEEGDEERDHAHHHARHQQRQYQSGLGVHAHMSPGHGGLWRNPSSFADAATLVRCIGAALGMGLVSLNSYSLTIAPRAQEWPDGRANL